MMDLYLEGQRMDLAPDAIFAVTVQSNDITKPESVQSSYSNTLTVPFTERNHRILENAAEVGSMTLTPYRKLEATVLQDGLEVVPLPRVFVNEAREGYELQVFSGSLDLFARLGDKSIRDLELSRFNHTWDAASVTAGASYARTFQSGYIYNPVDNGKPFSTAGLWAEDMHPSVFVRAVFEQMLQEAGVKYTGIDDELWDRLILPFSNDRPVHSQAWLEARMVDSDGREGLAFAPIPVTDHGKVEVRYSAEVDFVTEDQPSALALILWQGNMELDRQELPLGGIGFHELKATFDIHPYYDLEGLEIQITNVNLTNSGDTRPGFSTYTSRRVQSGYNEEAYFRTEWDVALNLPDIRQKDFFKAVRSLFDLMVLFDPYSNTVTLTPFNRLLENKPRALDWSAKLVYLRGQERVPVQYRFGSFAQRSWWRYKEDELGGEGDACLAVDDELLEKEKGMVTLPFAASAERSGVLDIPLFELEREAPQYDKITSTLATRDSESFNDKDRVYVRNASADQRVRHGWAVYERVEDRPGQTDGWVLVDQAKYTRNKVQPRIAVLNDPLQANTMSVKVWHSKTYGVQAESVGSSFSPISFASLLPSRYKALQGVLEKTKGITPWFLLTPADVANYDPSVPIWLDQFQEYFYLNNITEFTGEGPTECQLWRL